MHASMNQETEFFQEMVKTLVENDEDAVEVQKCIDQLRKLVPALHISNNNPNLSKHLSCHLTPETFLDCVIKYINELETEINNNQSKPSDPKSHNIPEISSTSFSHS
ncbi:hypothetical protein A3Q56_05423 [Intoshia linei]|uniref:BHLH domain-containing protein n=1 Tax=Intoshia linei TaxID=1819745 RepID=A0A177AZQ7_9BILA|nr:hypothetical protein A3Q56_05423 [Intoshia linei]